MGLRVYKQNEIGDISNEKKIIKSEFLVKCTTCTNREIAEYYGISITSVQQIKKAFGLSGVRKGGYKFILVDDVDG